MKLTVRLGSMEDLDHVLALSQGLFEADDQWFHNSNMAWSYQPDGVAFNKSFLGENKDKVCFLAEQDGKAVGYVTGGILEPMSAFPGKKARLWNIFVKPEAQDGGIGSQLVERFYVWCRQRDVKEVLLHSYEPNKRAHRFYGRHGFEPYEVVFRHEL